MENITAHRLKELRKQKGTTMEKMALETGIKKPTISNYENGYSKPKDNNLKKLANYYSVSPSYILGYSDELMTFDSGEEFKKARQKILDESSSEKKLVKKKGIDLTKMFEEMKKNGFKPTPINENSEDYLEYEKFLAEIEEENEANRKIFYKKYDTNEEEVLRFKSLLELFNELTESGQKEVIKFTKYLLQSQNESTDI